MLFELIIFTTIVLHHILIGVCLIIALLMLIKLFKPTAETQSWLWTTAFVLSTLLPLGALLGANEVLLANNLGIEKVAETENVGSKLVTKGETRFAVQEVNTTTGWALPGNVIYQSTKWFYVFFAIWFIGACWRSFSVLRSIFYSIELVSSAQVFNGANYFKNICNNRILTSKQIRSPMMVGLITPTIVIPKILVKQFDEEQLKPIILHELAHIQRKDLWVGMFQELISILFWWSPVLRIMNRKIHITRELACDMRAAKQLSSGKTYAQSLIDCARIMLDQHANVMAMGLFSKKRELTYRVDEVLKIKAINLPNSIILIFACFSLVATSVALANGFAPKIDTTIVKQESNHFSVMADQDSDLMLSAIIGSDYTSLRDMIAAGLDLNTPVKGEGTALIIAARRGDLLMVEKLIELGADVNQSALRDGNPLIAAAAAGNLKIAELLYRRGAEINTVVKFDETSLITASYYGHFDMVKFLVEQGADVNLGVEASVYRNNIEGVEFRTPLNRASSTQIREYLINQGATI